MWIITRFVKETEISRTCSTYEGKERCIQDVKKAAGRKPLARLRRGWEDNIKIDL
jgi:hypothetical protein